MTPALIIALARTRAGSLPRAAQDIGCTRMSLHRWGKGHMPSPRFWVALAQAAGVPLDAILSAWQVDKPLRQ